VVTSLAASDFYPGFGDSIDLSTLTPAVDPSNAPDLACAAAIEPLDLNLENVPTDLSAGYFYPGRDAWDEGDRTLLCYASSRTGIPGPLVNR
jgi:hypothetical protein